MFQKVFNTILLLAMVVSTGSFAQTIIIGAGASSGTASNGSTGDSGPMYRSSATSSFVYSTHHYLYTAAELSAAGLPAGATITSLAWNKANNAVSNSPFLFEIWMQNATLTTARTTPQTLSTLTSTATQVYSSSSTNLPSTIGYIDFSFSTPFTYNGDALEITVNFDISSGSSPWTSAGISWYRDAITGRTISYCGSSPNTTLSNARGVRPQLRITYVDCEKPNNVTASSITSNSANFTWSAVPGSIGYEYEVNTSSTAPTTAGTATTATTYNAFGLTSSTNYFFHVRNKCDATTFSQWETIPFTTLVNPCPFPATVTYNTPTASTADVHWDPVAGSLGYEYVIDQTTANPIGTGTAAVDTFAMLSGLTGGQTYYFHIRNKCSSTGGTWSDWNTIQFLMPECLTPVNTYFSDITDTSVDIYWSIMPVANLYEYQVDLNLTDPIGASGYATTTGMTAHVKGLLSNTKYYVHIRSRCFINDTSNWALDSFVTHYACNAPVPVVANPGSPTPVVNWTPIDDAVQYEYRVSSNPNHPPFGDITTTTTTMTTTLPNDGKNYYLHIRTKCNSQYEFSAWARADLRVTPTGIDVLEDDAFAINVYPNPAKNSITIKVAGNKEEDSQAQITDITGKVLLSAAIHSANTVVDISKLSPGIYLLKYQGKANNRVIKIEKN